MIEPSDEVIKRLKEQYPDRSLHQVEKYSSKYDLAYAFVMTGPSRDELDKFDHDLLKATDVKDAAERKMAVRTAVERSALAQIRWPDRDEAKRIFGLHPEIIFSFADDLRDFAGASFETRSKKL